MVINKGECSPLNDEAFFNLLTRNGSEYVDMVIRYYPELKVFVKN